MFSNMEGMGKMFESVQESATKIQDELESKTFTTKSGGGLIEVSINGKGEVVDLNIDDSLLEDKSSLQILLIGALNDANQMVQQNQKSSAMGMLSGLGGINPFAGK
ncbi:MAG: YbaB/EbfC family nucleoid-associated protein [Sulfurimonas sp.]|nr:YbaB/EbfC family nucleoid-associated protein [Sulfurimonas sp.]